MLKKIDAEKDITRSFYEDRRLWRDYLTTHSGISDRAFRVGCFIAMKSNRKDRCMWYSLRRFEEELGMSKSKLLRAIAELDEQDLIRIERVHRQPSRYHIRLPSHLV